MLDPLRHHHSHAHLHGAVKSNDRFGPVAERFARLFGTVRYLTWQTAMVLAWIAVNVIVVVLRWDPYPFILLNLLFSTQAAYAAPLILLAQNRQADRDKAQEEADANHREQIAQQHTDMLNANTRLTAEVHRLALQMHSRLESTAVSKKS